MYEHLLYAYRARQDTPESVTHHDGSAADFYRRMVKHAFEAGQRGANGIDKIAPLLVKWISDARTLRLAFDDLAKRGGAAPGPSGLTYDILDNRATWSLCRALGKAIRTNHYRPGKERLVHVPKNSGDGTRPLILQEIIDRVVQRAVVKVLQPLLEPRFDPNSFGFRPRRGRLNAMALAERHFKQENRTVWIIDDIKDAFTHVPLPRLLQVVQKYVRAPDVVNLVERILSNASMPGLRQGGPLSPLLLNLYLHHNLDRKWRKRRPEVPLIRVADDIAIFCRSTKGARAGYAALQNLLLPTGMQLKYGAERAVRTLSARRPAKWLGFQLQKDPRGLGIQITEREWKRLHKALALAHAKLDAPLRAIDILKGWISQLGPCYAWMDREAVCGRITGIAEEHAFDELPRSKEVKRLWQRSYARYRKLVRAVEASHVYPTE